MSSEGVLYQYIIFGYKSPVVYFILLKHIKNGYMFAMLCLSVPLMTSKGGFPLSEKL
jgi:hypothetical protein